MMSTTFPAILSKRISLSAHRSHQVTDIYVSPSSRSNTPIASRDSTNEQDFTDISGCVGNTQALLKYLSSTTKLVYIVIVDYAALSTDSDDILRLIRNYKSLEYIVVDRFQDIGKYEVYKRNQILETPEQLAAFGCRQGFPHRSVQNKLYVVNDE
ncbi:hypothetical protein INT45_010375 [Circinella minor]|uniref:Uncharacterized protein n=1 Tax=Circinella minor TaxID=1195481 RepID=A0A8H7RZ95_9FUNG|nr:hypothetical protein INT45_010375 [Circinella minor]